MTSQRGIALIIVLWCVTLLSLLAASLAQNSGLASRRSLNMVKAAQARARLDEAVAAAVLFMQRPERRWRPDRKIRRIDLGGATAEVQILAESGRIDLNKSPPALVAALFRGCAGDAGRGDHLTAALAARVAQRPLLDVAELGGLPGMSAALYHCLAPLVTVHNSSGRLDWRLADPAVLALIPDLSDSQRASLVAMQQENKYSPEPALAELLGRLGINSAADPNAGENMGMITVRVSVVLNGGGQASAETLLTLSDNAAPYHVVAWRAPLDRDR